ncbi:3-isopropylmalate dehydratase small subunit [Sphingomonas sp. MG17]|uniref:3-isopropylmalate dehydratase n=1 Tax=Sphingomonas tagetis TaxID=2949092 RepID=A0A9X2KL25_9SPHN|nr:3-isopropylmalate dehydratase small subunit [Sphingomonas tagetis]MCP3730330.1 3-isopropylmalate dehydratase small subunit [Sphingomonas tagetis]
MQIFTTLTAVAAALPVANIDTDKILSGEHLKTIGRHGLGTKLFSMLRYDERGDERPDFVLNRDPWRSAGILISLENFGCGSSREHAPWALADFGLRCIIAPSFADIFYANCFKNGILPVVLARRVVDALMLDASDGRRARMHIDLPAQTITRWNGEQIEFDIAPDRKQALLFGRDEIAETLEKAAAISCWEQVASLIAVDIPVDIGAYP